MLVNVVMRRNALESLLFAVTLAVELTPELLQMITSVTLAAGAAGAPQPAIVIRGSRPPLAPRFSGACGLQPAVGSAHKFEARVVFGRELTNDPI